MPVRFLKTGKSTVRFADVHCHILYGVDDGSRSREMSLSMLKQAASEGVEAMILTPHFFAGRSTLTKESIRERTEILTEQCAAEGIGIELFPGAELYYTEEADEALAQGAVPTLNGTNRLLVEFSTDVLDGWKRSGIRARRFRSTYRRLPGDTVFRRNPRWSAF